MKNKDGELIHWLHPELEETVKVFSIDEKYTKVQEVILLQSCYKGHKLSRSKMDGFVQFLKNMKGKAVIVANNHDAEIILSDESDEAVFLLKFT